MGEGTLLDTTQLGSLHTWLSDGGINCCLEICLNFSPHPVLLLSCHTQTQLSE